MLSTNREPMQPAIPKTRKTGQHFTPKWYSHLMTMGWKTPMHRKVPKPNMMP